jgi:hypothetical protein
MRAGLALAFSVVALLAVTASAAAEPPSQVGSVQGPFTPLALDGRGLVVDRPPVETTPVPSRLPASFEEAGRAPVPTLGPRPRRVPSVGVVVKPTPTPRPARQQISGGGGGGGGSALRGLASWYCNRDGSRAQLSPCHYRYPDTAGFDAYAAAGPRLRRALGGSWRGRVVSVDGIRVKLVDWCQCYQGQRHEKVIDPYLDVFRRVGGEVTIRW